MSPLVDQKPFNAADRLKDYTDVKQRIVLFYAKHPDGRLVTDSAWVSVDDDVPRVWVRAYAYRTPDDPHPGVGHSWMVLPGTTPYTRGSEIENAETSAWGRAIGSLGIGIDKSIASVEEIASKDGKPPHEEEAHTDDGSLIGTVAAGKPPVDLNLRQTPDGALAGFKLTQGAKGLQVLASGPLADALQPFLAELVGVRVQCWGTVEMVPWERDGKAMPPFRRLNLERIVTPEFTLPAEFVQKHFSNNDPEAVEAESVPLFPDDDLSDVAGYS